MSVEIAKRYFELMDSTSTGTDEVLDLYAEGATIKSPRKGVIHGKDDIQSFYEANAEFFTGGEHVMEHFHHDGDTVICEGTLDGSTVEGRNFEGVGLVDIMSFDDNDKIESFRAYLDYSAVLTEVPDDEDVPSFRDD
ncbi:hypothetical protein AUR64_03745 [Haloprofundus marisrubri]|uniref:SnoaL-like domain-containing protein n=1 Tax=Haloprofundus marisrubri TaxID=1514971 RepID=A0A0W1RE81_9EURY|nr:nuclear transport factor 2 family protein [Haloprofundus marisrubri]KTG11379.1 hypothetical protein AUR64_03745 [Haloprofundus marisrubri]